MKYKYIKFSSLKSGIHKNRDCWQSVTEKVKGLGKIERHTRVEIIDVDKINQTVLIKYLSGGYLKLNQNDFDSLKLFN